MTTHITQQQLESYLWGAATLLRGTIDAGDYKQFIFPPLFYKRLCDVFDEETRIALTESGGDDQQRRIAEILWAVDEIGCAWETNQRAIHEVHEGRLRNAFENSNSRWPIRALEGVARVERGKFSHRPRNLPEFYGGDFPFVQTGDVQNAERFLKRFEYQLTELGMAYSKSFPVGTIFVTIAAVIGATAISNCEVFVTDSVVGVVPFDDMDVDYLELFLRHKRHFLENQAATQTAQKNINLQVLRPLAVPCPPRSDQERIAAEILEPFHASKKAQTYVEKIHSLLRFLTTRIVEITP